MCCARDVIHSNLANWNYHLATPQNDSVYHWARTMPMCYGNQFHLGINLFRTSVIQSKANVPRTANEKSTTTVIHFSNTPSTKWYLIETSIVDAAYDVSQIYLYVSIHFHIVLHCDHYLFRSIHTQQWHSKGHLSVTVRWLMNSSAVVKRSSTFSKWHSTNIAAMIYMQPSSPTQ